MSIARNIDYLTSLPDVSRLMRGEGLQFFKPQTSRLSEQHSFGSNPGELRMMTYAPVNLPRKPALVVVLHGCAQNAAAYDYGSGWSQLADKYGFVLLFPQQRRRNNANMCFNWFVPGDVATEGGELQSIQQMIEHIARERKIDRSRIYVTGLSAGGSMAAALLARHPSMFAAGAIIAGVPFGAADNLKAALNTMFKAPPVDKAELGHRLRAASSHKTRWPRISIWHGSADTTVHPANGDHLLAQWLDVHELPTAPMFTDVVDGHPRYGWWGKDGQTVVETFAIRDMAHGAPLATGGEHRYGQPAPYMIEAGISSSWHIANFFGITRAPVEKSVQRTAKQLPIAKKPAAAKTTKLADRARAVVRRLKAK